MNIVFLVIILVGFLFAGWRQITWLEVAGQASPMEVLSAAVVEAAGASVELAIGLIGVMTLFLGLMKIAEAGGLLTLIARLIRPLMVRLFPDVPPEHPAMGAMVLNLSANAMGLGNAATPFGIKAMQQLERAFFSAILHALTMGYMVLQSEGSWLEYRLPWSAISTRSGVRH